MLLNIENALPSVKVFFVESAYACVIHSLYTLRSIPYLFKLVEQLELVDYSRLLFISSVSLFHELLEDPT